MDIIFLVSLSVREYFAFSLTISLSWRSPEQLQSKPFFPIKKNIRLNKRMILSSSSLSFLFSLLFFSSLSHFSSENKGSSLSEPWRKKNQRQFYSQIEKTRKKKIQNLSNFCNACILLLRSESKDFLSQKKFWRQRSFSSSSQSKHTTILFS